MMRASSTTWFLATGLLGAFAIVAYGVIRMIPDTPAAPPVEVRPIAAALPLVVIARRPIRRGELVTADDLDQMPIGGTLPPTVATGADAVIGKVAMVDIAPYQLVLSDMISADATRAGLSSLVPPGFRALELRTTDEVAVGNFLRAGDHVDVLLVLPDSVLPLPGAATPGVAGSGDARQGSSSEARSLLQDVLVLAVGEQLGAPSDASLDTSGRRPEPPHGVTVALTPDQVTRVTLARSLGALFLALRNPGDPTTAADTRTRLADLRGSAPADGRRPIELIAGSRSRMIYSQPAATPAGDQK